MRMGEKTVFVVLQAGVLNTTLLDAPRSSDVHSCLNQSSRHAAGTIQTELEEPLRVADVACG
jgi:hypothetical protein